MMIMSIHFILFTTSQLFLGFYVPGSTGSENVITKGIHDTESRSPTTQQGSGWYHYVMVFAQAYFFS